MTKGAFGFIHVALIVTFMALSVPTLMLLVNTISKSSHPYIADKTLIQPRDGVEIVEVNGTKYPFVRQGINLKPEDILFSYLVFDEYSPDTTKHMKVKYTDGNLSGEFDMTSPTNQINRLDNFPNIYNGSGNIKLKEVNKKGRWFMLWDSNNKSWTYSIDYPKNYR